MKVRLTFDFSEFERQAVANHYGEDKPASYEHMRRWVEIAVSGTMEDLAWDLQKKEERMEEGYSEDEAENLREREVE